MSISSPVNDINSSNTIPGPELNDPIRAEPPWSSSFVVEYEGWSTHSHNHVISMQPLGIGNAFIPHMKPL